VHNDIKALEKRIADLQSRISYYELAEQRTRHVQHKLDSQVEMLTHIHEYTQRALHEHDMHMLSEIIAEGVVGVFQVECGAVFTIDPLGDRYILDGSCNLDTPGLELSLCETWLKQYEIVSFKKHKVYVESPVPEDSPWASLGFVHAVFVPVINIERKCEAIILGGVTAQNKAFYDFDATEIASSFMVYCQQMNGIYNNLISLEKANRAAKEKTIFLTNLSHEMRTPLNAIIGMLHMYMKNRGTHEVEKEIQQIEVSSKFLVNLINEILDISKIEEGVFVLDREGFDLKSVVEDVYGSLAQTANAKKQVVTLDFGNLRNFALIGDATRLSQVLINLVSNAIKFTPQNGKIEIVCRELVKGDDRILIKFAVKDDGIGIAPGALTDIFVPFKQAENNITKKYGGTGLGLAISQRIVNLMGNEIRVESELGVGSSFEFSVWFEIDKDVWVDDETEGKSEAAGLAGKRLLVVDDVDINREIVCFMLGHMGIATEQAENGQEAVEMVKASPEGYYDMVLMDVQMPVMDGYTATKEIKAMDRQDVVELPIIAMTANAFREDVEQALKSGMKAHIKKPIEEKVLYETLSKMRQ